MPFDFIKKGQGKLAYQNHGRTAFSKLRKINIYFENNSPQYLDKIEIDEIVILQEQSINQPVDLADIVMEYQDIEY